MNKRISIALFSTLISLLGCVDNNSSITITGVIQPDSECIIDPAAGLRMSVGRLSTDVDNKTYYVSLGLSNRVLTTSSAVSAETNDVQISAAEIGIYSPTGELIPLNIGGAAAPNPVRVGASAYVPSARDTESPGVAAITVPALPASYVAALRGLTGGQITLGIRLVGKTLGDLDIETGEYMWPVELCNGINNNCVFFCAEGETDDICLDYFGQDFPQSIPLEDPVCTPPES